MIDQDAFSGVMTVKNVSLLHSLARSRVLVPFPGNGNKAASVTPINARGRSDELTTRVIKRSLQML